MWLVSWWNSFRKWKSSACNKNNKMKANSLIKLWVLYSAPNPNRKRRSKNNYQKDCTLRIRAVVLTQNQLRSPVRFRWPKACRAHLVEASRQCCLVSAVSGIYLRWKSLRTLKGLHILVAVVWHLEATQINGKHHRNIIDKRETNFTKLHKITLVEFLNRSASGKVTATDWCEPVASTGKNNFKLQSSTECEWMTKQFLNLEDLLSKRINNS